MLGIERADFGTEVHLAERLGHRFAHLRDDELGKLLPAFDVEFARAHHECGPLGDGHVRHRAAVGGGSSGNGGVEFRIRVQGVGAQGLARRWVSNGIGAQDEALQGRR